MDKQTRFILGIGLILIAITLVWFFIGFTAAENTTLNMIALFFVLIAEAAFIGGLFMVTNGVEDMNSIILKAGVVSTLSMYMLATVLMAIFRGFFNHNLNAFVTAQITIVGVAAIIIITIVMGASAKFRVNQ